MMIAMSSEDPKKGRSSWEALGNSMFRALWVATFISSMGSWMHRVADGWLMASLSPDPFLVSLIQVLTTLPLFVLALPAGTLADLVDRRRYLLFTQSWMLLASGSMALLTWQGWMTPELLLLTTFVMALGVALNSPGWHAVTPEVVSREELPGAVALNGMALNCARALGPALAGMILLWFGPETAFLLNSLSFVAVIMVLGHWQRKPPAQTIPREGFLPAMRVGVRHVRHSPWLRTVVVRAPLFLLSTSCLWALLPVVCQRVYGFGPRQYGLALATFGLGAVVGGLKLLPPLRARLKLDQIVTLFWLTFAASLVGLSVAQSVVQVCSLMFLAGASWLCVLTNFHFVVQSSAPAWVQGRAMSLYLLCFFGAATTGSALWGYLARVLGAREAFLVSGVLLTMTALSRLIAPLNSAQDRNLDPSGAWPDPEIASQVPLNHGPIMVVVEYLIAPEDAPSFRKALEQLRTFRYQNGITQWGFFIDIADPKKYREVYFEESWGAHLRHHQRVTAFETEVASKVYDYHRGEGMPPVFHYAMCNDQFPIPVSPPGKPPQLQRYATDSRGIPLWFLDDFNSYPKVTDRGRDLPR
jgi:MFS family permease